MRRWWWLVALLLLLGAMGGFAAYQRHHEVQVRGPYGAHVLRITAPVTDLGGALRAPALDGLRVTLSGHTLLLLGTPAGVQLRAAGDSQPLRDSQPLPAHALLDFLPPGPGA